MIRNLFLLLLTLSFLAAPLGQAIAQNATDVVDLNDCESVCSGLCNDPIYCGISYESDITACENDCLSSCDTPYGITYGDLQEEIYNYCEGVVSAEEALYNANTGGPTVGQGEQAAAALENPIAASSMPEIIVNVIQVLLTLLGSAALLVFIYGGITLITSAGNEEKVKKARATLVWAVLGLAVILGSYAILSFVFGIFG